MAKNKSDSINPQRPTSHSINWSEILNHQIPATTEDLLSVLLPIRKNKELAELAGVVRKFEFHFPAKAANFLIGLADLPENPTILFARNDIGILPYCIRQLYPKASFTFYSDDINIHEYHSYLFPGEKAPSPKALLDLAAEEKEKYDLVIGGIRRKSRRFITRDAATGIVKFDDDSGPSDYDDQQFLTVLSKLLKDDGRLISDMWEEQAYDHMKDREAMRHWMQCCKQLTGLSINAVIEDLECISDGYPWSYATNNMVVVISSKTQQGKVFSAQYSDDERIQETITTSFLKLSNAKRVHAGHWSSLSSYEPNSRLRHNEQIRWRASKAGLSPVKLGEILGPEDGRQNVFSIAANAYIHEDPLPLVSHGTDMPEEDPRVWINQKKALAEYIVGFLNESELGKMIHPDLIAESDDTYSLVSKESICGLEVYLPDLKTQEKVLQIRNMLASLRSEIDENLLSMWHEPKSCDDVFRKVKQINTKDNFSTWIDLLPFPLASVLWSYHTQCRTDKEKIDKLLHFFEACAEFLSIVHSSALASTRGLWHEIRPRIAKEVKEGHVQMQRPSFGTWNTLLEVMTKFTREGIRNDKFRLEILNAYKVSQIKPIKQLSESKIISVLKLAVSIRNDQAHGGAISDSKARDIHQRLAFGLQDMRELITEIWEYYDLVLSGSGKYSGGEYLYEVERITGNRTPFERSEISTVEPLEHGRLYLVSRETNRAIKLLPFLQVIPSPSTEVDACYFYNRIEQGTGKARFVSYHYGKDAEFHTQIDTDISAALGLFEG